MEEQWHGENPFYLLIRHKQESDGATVHTVVDLDEPGWATIHKSLMRLPGRWFLVNKETRLMPIAMVVEEGDQPYYTARHIGQGSMTSDKVIQSEVIAYGIGRKHPDGYVERLWHFIEGVTVMGEDVFPIGIEVLNISNAIKLAQREEEEKESRALQEQQQVDMMGG